MAQNKARQVALNILLLKEELAAHSDAPDFRGYLREGTTDTLTPVPLPSLPSGVLWIESRKTGRPGWLSFLEGLPQDLDIHTGVVTSAVIFTLIKDRTFAVTFGRGKTLLRMSCWEEDFALKTTLSLVDPSQLRSVDKKTLDAIIQNSRVQNALPGDSRDFGINVEQDLMRAVAGQPASPADIAENPPDYPIESMLYGGSDALVANVRATLAHVPALLHRYLEAYRSQKYRDNFSWVDNLAEVRDRVLIASLDEQLDRQLATPNGIRPRLVVPEILDWSDIRGFAYKDKPQEEDICDALDIDEFEAFLGKSPLTLGEMKGKSIHIVGADTNPDSQGRHFTKHRWPILRCVYGEVQVPTGDAQQGNAVYIRSDNRWYRVLQDFVAKVDADVDLLIGKEFSLPPYEHALILRTDNFKESLKEHYYCHQVAETLGPAGWMVLDRGKVTHGGSHSAIELCDLLFRHEAMLHMFFVKRQLNNDDGPANLSHLFAQGYTSISLLEADPEFTRKANSKVVPFAEFQRSRMRDIRAIFVIITQSPGAPSRTLPFFSRLNLRNTARSLQRLGVSTSIYFVPSDEPVKKRVRQRPNRAPKPKCEPQRGQKRPRRSDGTTTEA